eukprot:5095193-Pleurochrysis_carterae.AAC.1
MRLRRAVAAERTPYFFKIARQIVENERRSDAQDSRAEDIHVISQDDNFMKKHVSPPSLDHCRLASEGLPASSPLQGNWEGKTTTWGCRASPTSG